MKNFLRKLHIDPTPPAAAAGGGGGSESSPRKGGGGGVRHVHKPPSGISRWLSSVTNRHAAAAPPPAPPPPAEGGVEAVRREPEIGAEDAAAAAATAAEEDLEEYQIQLALEKSTREDPEAVEIEVAKQISLGSCRPESTQAEVVAYRYWNYNALSYDDKILDGFYDLYGFCDVLTSLKMPPLVDLQSKPLSHNASWEAVLVNRTEDADLLELEQKALIMSLELHSESSKFSGGILIQRLACLVANYMGGAVCDPESMFILYRSMHGYLRTSVGNMVSPLGRVTIGLARHRALLFKILTDSLGIPCRLVKGKQYTGSEDGALNIVKFKDGREYIVDLMEDPGTLIPSDGAGPVRECEVNFFPVNHFNKEIESIHMGSLISGVSRSACCSFENKPLGQISIMSGNLESSDTGEVSSDLSYRENTVSFSSQKHLTSTGENVSSTINTKEKSTGAIHSPTCAGSLSEGINSPAVHRMKVKDVSEYMINAAKENLHLAEKLHDILLESGVVAPPGFFSDISVEHSVDVIVKNKNKMKKKNELEHKTDADGSHAPFLPHQPVKGLALHFPSGSQEVSHSFLSQGEASVAPVQEAPMQLIKQMPVAADAVATAAVVVSSMVVAAAKSDININFEVPVAAAVVATTAVVTKQYEQLESFVPLANFSGFNEIVESTRKTGHAILGKDGGIEQEKHAAESSQLMERNSDKSTGPESAKSGIALDDVAEFEVPWEDIIVGERIGLGSFGEVYKGDLHGTKVAVKKFFHQDISSDALEVRSEVRIMRRLRHPNVVLFMGAITRVPNLSIVTEFLPRGNLFRLIHWPNNQLDERRRLRMALDVARGMNYLHNCTPIIVHHDLKSPNLLVDKNWVVKIGDFGLSQIKHNTFLSSGSTAGTAEWMAPEVLRNEPSDEKCDVFSFGVILWELCTLQQPWEGMNPMQVVGAVAFQHRRLDIPDDVDPAIEDIIKKCWQTDPKMRPSFSEIMASLKSLLKILAHTRVLRPRVPAAVDPEKNDS